MGHTHERTSTSIAGDTSRRDDRDEDYSVHDMGQGDQASVTVGNDEWGGVDTRSTEEIFVHRVDGDRDHERTEDVEQRQTQPHRADGARDRLARVGCFRGDKGAILGSGHRKDTSRHDGEKTFEAVRKGLRIPVAEANGTLGGSASCGHNWEVLGLAYICPESQTHR